MLVDLVGASAASSYNKQPMQSLLAFLWIASSVSAWVSPTARELGRLPPPTALHHNSKLPSSSPPSSTSTMTNNTLGGRNIVARSSLTLLEHININIPSHEYLDFYFKVLGLGLDPRKASNLRSPDSDRKTVWGNCGVSQLHLPHGDTVQVIPGSIGLVFDDLDGLKERLRQYSTLFREANDSSDTGSGTPFIEIIDHYGNKYHCRSQESLVMSDPEKCFQPQPIVLSHDTVTWGEDITSRFGRQDGTTDCKGISYVEFLCPAKTARTIAEFYEVVFEAASTVVECPDGSAAAVVGIGRIDDTGKADQALVFRETTLPIPKYDGHHIALYVGEDAAGFEEAFLYCLDAGVVWVNPRFSDKADSLEGARQYKQFRFKNIVDVKTGKKVFELEHEIRSVEHECWTGRMEA